MPKKTRGPVKEPPITLVRFKTKDNLEFQGHLYKPARHTKKIIIHIHGLIGNFYENIFVEEIANEAIKNGWALLAFNNRGAGIIQDFIKTQSSKYTYERIGGSVEVFEDSILDINAAIKFATKRGYSEVVLQGHSLGCQKAAYYCAKSRNKNIKQIIFLSPADDVSCVKMFLGKRYKTALKLAQQLAANKQQKRLPDYMEFYPLMTAARFLDIASPDTVAGSLLDYNGPMTLLRSIKIPVLAIFCKNDPYQPDTSQALEILKSTLTQCDTKLISGGDHHFPKKEKALAKFVLAWLKGKSK